MNSDEPAIIDRKTELRLKMGEVRRRMTPDSKAAASVLARSRLLGLQEWRESRTVMIYSPLPDELDMWAVGEVAIRERKVLCLPRYEESVKTYVPCQVNDLSADLVAGKFGIREPGSHCAKLPSNALDFILVPGVAFDMHGHRLGRGKGYYDRMLSAAPGMKCGVAFDEQVVLAVPVLPHDVVLNCILTPTRWAKF